MNKPEVSYKNISDVIEKHGDMVRRICFLYLRERADVEDVFQEVFLKYFLHVGSFESEQHEKAWICRVTFNQCKDLKKSFWSRRVISLDQMEIPCQSLEENEVMTAILKLPTAFKEVVYLHYCEGLTIPEIAALTQQNVNTVYTQLRRAKEKLKRMLRRDV